MKRSPEIENLMRDSVAALERSDLAFIEKHTSRADGTVAIGTDPDEYARDFDTIMRLMADSTPKGDQQIKVVIDDVKHNATLAAMLAYLASEDPELIARDRSPGTWPANWPANCGKAPRATRARL